jgi:hypothetical protein
VIPLALARLRRVKLEIPPRYSQASAVERYSSLSTYRGILFSSYKPVVNITLLLLVEQYLPLTSAKMNNLEK